MNKSAKTIEITGPSGEALLFAYGAVNDWVIPSDLETPLNERLEFGYAKLGKDNVGQFLLPKNKDYHSLAVLLSLIEPTSLFSFVINSNSNNADSVWLSRSKNGKIIADSDRIYQFESEQQRNDVHDILAEAKQLTPQDKVFVFHSEDDLFDFLSNRINDDILKQSKIKFQKSTYRHLKSILLISTILAGAGYWWYNDSLQQEEVERLRHLNNLKIYEDSKTSIIQQIDIKYARDFIKTALSLPHEVMGFRVKSINCSVDICTTFYENINAQLISSVILKLKDYSEHVIYDAQNRMISVSVSMDFPKSSHIPDFSSSNLNMMWLDYINIIQNSATANITKSQLIQGAEFVGSSEMVGNWSLEGIPVQRTLSLTDGLNKLVGVRFNTFTYTPTKTAIGGSYAIKDI